MLAPRTYLQNRYKILERTGSGGMSVMCKTRCYTLNRLVAIKVLKEEFTFNENFVSKFKMEVQSAAHLSHPDIVNVYDVVDKDMYHYVVMGLIEGITFKNYIENKGHLESKEATGTALQVGQGIAATHKQHIIYRDIKLQNVIIFKDSKVKVADFGTTRAVSSQTMSATAAGSARYISPEQARGGYRGKRSSTYSFDITMYEMVIGHTPFGGGNTVIVALARLEGPVTPPSQYVPDMSRAMEQIILKCIQKRPDRRCVCVTDTIENLQAALVNLNADIYACKDGEEDEFGKIGPITRGGLSNIQEDRRSYSEEVLEEPEGEQSGHQDRSRTRGLCKKEGRTHTRKKNEGDDVSTQFERIITAFGIMTIIIIVAVMLFVFSRLAGIFKQGSDKLATETTSMTTEDSTIVAGINTEDQMNMLNVLGLLQGMAREKLKESSFVMEITDSEYPDNYIGGQVMGQDILVGTVVKKWSTVRATVSKGSDKVDLNVLDLTQVVGEDARSLLKQKELVVEAREENGDTAIEGNMIRFSLQVVKVGEGVSLYVSKGSQNVEGHVPSLQEQTPTSAGALLAEVGLLTGNIIVEASDTVEEGLIISQSELPGIILPLGAAVDYVVSGEPVQIQAADERYYIGSIDEACSLSSYIGPVSQTGSVRVLIRLNQTDDEGTSVYITLTSPKLVVDAQIVPVVFSRTKRAYDVDSNMVETVGADNLIIIKSHPMALFPVG